MKNSILTSIYSLVLLLVVSCSSDMRMPDVQKVSLPLIKFDASSAQTIQDGVFSGKIVFDLYYKDYPADANIVVRMNGDNTKIKTFKTGIKTFPTTLSLTNVDLQTLFGIPVIVAGNYFEFGIDVKMEDGKWYPAFNANGVAYGSGPVNLPGSNPILKLPAVCALNIDAFVGTANIDDSDWYTGTYSTTIEKIDATHLKWKNYAELNGDIIITIDPVGRKVSVAKQVYTTNLALWNMAQYTNPAAQGSGEIDACKRSITMVLTNTVDQGSFGTTNIKITY